MKRLLSTLGILSVTLMICAQEPAYLNTGLAFEDRVNDLVSRMTLEEKGCPATLYSAGHSASGRA